MNADREAIAQTVARNAEAWNRHDPHALALTFTEDADFTNVVGRHASGHAAIEQFHAPVVAGPARDSHLTSTVSRIRFLTPDFAVIDADWQMTGVRGPDGAPRPDRRGLLDFVMARQPDGSWLIAVMHNTDLSNAPPRT